MAEEYLSKAVHEAVVARIDDEQKRQNARIEKLEEIMEVIQDQTVSIRTMTASIETMSQELKRHSERLDQLEAEPGKKWQRLVDGIIGAIAGLVGSGIIYAIIANMK